MKDISGLLKPNFLVVYLSILNIKLKETPRGFSFKDSKLFKNLFLSSGTFLYMPLDND